MIDIFKKESFSSLSDETQRLYEYIQKTEISITTNRHKEVNKSLGKVIDEISLYYPHSDKHSSVNSYLEAKGIFLPFASYDDCIYFLQYYYSVTSWYMETSSPHMREEPIENSLPRVNIHDLENHVLEPIKKLLEEENLEIITGEELYSFPDWFTDADYWKYYVIEKHDTRLLSTKAITAVTSDKEKVLNEVVDFLKTENLNNSTLMYSLIGKIYALYEKDSEIKPHLYSTKIELGNKTVSLHDIIDNHSNNYARHPIRFGNADKVFLDADELKVVADVIVNSYLVLENLLTLNSQYSTFSKIIERYDKEVEKNLQNKK